METKTDAVKSLKWNDNLLTDDKKKKVVAVRERIEQLMDTRKDHFGTNLDKLWSEADQAYIPHRINTTGGKKKKAIVTDEERGWRGQMVDLNSSQWQSDISEGNVYIKIGVALSILIDQNPSGVFSASGKKYEKTTELIKQLYEKSWEIAQSKGQLKLFVHNLAKYGFACARTYPLKLTRKVQHLTQYNDDSPEDSVYEEKEVIEYNDVYRENLDPRNVWVDDGAKPNNTMSVKDWTWRKVYTMKQAEQEFGKYKNWKYVVEGGNTEDTIDEVKSVGKKVKSKRLVEAKFYESIEDDCFIVFLGSVPIIVDPMPIADNNGAKKLSLWMSYWTLRHAESIYGIGIYEAIRYEQGLVDRFRNMTIDQLTLAIYKMFFYQGTQALTDTGEIQITPGKGKQVLDPKNITWLEVPGPGKDAYEGIAMMRKSLDEASGITDPLMGEVTGKTAFELAQAKEAALKRMKTPLDNILDALNNEGYITVALMQMLYSVPETYEISDPDLIDAYLQEIGSDPELFDRTEEGVFTAKVYREFPLNLDKDEKGNLIESDDTKFIRMKPSSLSWHGIINIKSQSMLTPSKQIDKTLELEMWNMLIPLLAQPPEIYMKPVKEIIKLYDKDPKDILPDSWLNPQPMQQPLFVDQHDAQAMAQQGAQPGQQPPLAGAQKVQPGGTQMVGQQPKSIVGQTMNKLTQGVR